MQRTTYCSWQRRCLKLQVAAACVGQMPIRFCGRMLLPVSLSHMCYACSCSAVLCQRAHTTPLQASAFDKLGASYFELICNFNDESSHLKLCIVCHAMSGLATKPGSPSGSSCCNRSRPRHFQRLAATKCFTLASSPARPLPPYVIQRSKNSRIVFRLLGAALAALRRAQHGSFPPAYEFIVSVGLLGLAARRCSGRQGWRCAQRRNLHSCVRPASAARRRSAHLSAVLAGC